MVVAEEALQSSRGKMSKSCEFVTMAETPYLAQIRVGSGPGVKGGQVELILAAVAAFRAAIASIVNKIVVVYNQNRAMATRVTSGDIPAAYSTVAYLAGPWLCW